MKLKTIVLILSCFLVVHIGYKFIFKSPQNLPIRSKEGVAKLNKELNYSAYEGNYEKVKSLVEQGADVNSVDLNSDDKGGHYTALHQAAARGMVRKAALDLSEKPKELYVSDKLKIAKLLIEHGANVNATNKFGVSPLHLTEIKEMAELLIGNGAKVDAEEYFGDRYTPLFTAGEKFGDKGKGVAEVLIKHGANVNHHNPDGKAPLMSAALNGNLETAKILIEHGADINHQDKNSESALIRAFEGKNMELVDVLIDRGADVNIISTSEQSPLHYATLFNDLRIVNKLLTKTKNIDPATGSGFTPLMQALLNKNLEIAQVLINHGANVDHINKHGRTALVNYVSENNLEMAEFLIKNGANVNFVSEENWSNRPMVCFVSSKEMMYLLLNNGADTNATDSNGKGLHFCLGDKKDLIEMAENSSRNKVNNKY